MNNSLTKHNFKEKVLDNTILTLVKFKTEWSGPCQIIYPVYAELAKSYRGIAEFFCVDIDKDELLHREYGVSELPTILFFRSGKIIDHAVGLIPKNQLIAKIENALNSSQN